MTVGPLSPEERAARSSSSSIGSPGGTGDSIDPYRKNPGLRIKLRRDPQLTKAGVLVRDFVFPVPPLDSLPRGLVADWQDYQTVNAGQFSRPVGMQLQTLVFDTILIADDYPWGFYNPLRTLGWDPFEQARQLGRIMRSMSPFWLIAEQARYKPSGTGFDFGSAPVLKMLATMRSLTPTSKNGEPECVYVNVAFSEHRSANLVQKALGKAGASGTAGSSIGGSGSGKGGPNSSKLPVSLSIGDFRKTPKPAANTLHDLATIYYGSASKWTTIKDKNPWLGNITADHDLGDWNTSELRTAGKANRRLTLPVIAAGGRQ